MKKILAVAVAAAFYAGTAGAATVYSDDSSRLDILGRVKVDLANNDADAEHRMLQTARFGVYGKTAVTDGISVFGRMTRRRIVSTSVTALQDLISVTTAHLLSDVSRMHIIKVPLLLICF